MAELHGLFSWGVILTPPVVAQPRTAEEWIVPVEIQARTIPAAARVPGDFVRFQSSN